MLKRMKKISRKLALVLVFAVLMSQTVVADEVSKLKDEKKKADQEIKNLEDQLAALLIEIDETEDQLIEKGEAILTEQENLAEMEALKSQQYNQMKLRIKYMYESGNDISLLLQMLSSTNNLSDNLNKYEYAEKISEYDRKQLEAYANNISAIEETINTLEIEQAELEAMSVAYSAKQDEINKLIEDKKKSVKDLDKKIEEAVKKAEEAKKKKKDPKTPNTPVTPDTPGNVTGAQIVSTAMQYLGTPYVAGGHAPGGFDCSGFTSYIFGLYGITLSRASSAQRSAGVGVSMSDIQPGDLVCYSGHVAIYIGNGQIVHASVPGDVVKVASMYIMPVICVRRCY